MTLKLILTGLASKLRFTDFVLKLMIKITFRLKCEIKLFYFQLSSKHFTLFKLLLVSNKTLLPKVTCSVKCLSLILLLLPIHLSQ